MASPSQSVAHAFSSLQHKLCVAVTGATPAAMVATAHSLLPEFPFLEFRLDHLADPGAALADLAPFLASHNQAMFLATCRPERSGGSLRGSAQDELQLLVAAAHAGFAVVDLSLESAEELGAPAVAHLRQAGAIVQLSFHDFAAPASLPDVLTRMRPYAPDLYKVVPTAQTLSDSLSLLQELRTTTAQQHAEPVVAMAMGEAGVLTRILGPSAGSAYTFAAATDADATAPGQVAAHTLSQLYRIGGITPATRVFGVAGDPIRSSLSPLMLNTAFRQASQDAVYLPLKTADANELLRVIRELPLAGCSVTMPLKQAILPLLDHTDPLAARIGAVNTIHRTPDGKLHGYNTDAAGIVVPLERRRKLRGASVLVLGAGGAARAAVFACAERGAEVFLHNRTDATAEALAHEAGATALSRGALSTEAFDIVINATPAGMRGNAWTLPLEAHELRTELVFDLVYNPAETPLLAMARAKGIDTIPGIEMFVHQGARQFELWTGTPAPTDLMQQVVSEALSSR